jgi:NAD(P)H-nitrite reductase
MATIKFAITPGFEEGGTLFTPEQLEALGTVVGDNAKFELTTFKQLYVEMQDERVEEVTQRLTEVGLQIYPAGFVSKSLITCYFCRGAEDAGLDIAKKLNEAIAGIQTPTPLKIGYAGCALGTSEPLLKDIGIVKMRDVFDIYVGGDPKSIKPQFAKLLVSGIAADNLSILVQKLISHYKEHAKGKEKYAKYVNRMTIEVLRDAIGGAA